MSGAAKKEEIMEDFALWFVRCAGGEEPLLGRRAGEYLQAEFGEFSPVTVDCEEECAPGGREFDVVLTTDMPLVTLSDIERAFSEMRRHKIARLGLGGADSRAKILWRGGKKNGYSLSLANFAKLDGAKGASVVYNQMKERILQRLLDAGVKIRDTANTVVDDTARVEAGAELLPFTRIVGASEVLSGAVVAGSHIEDSVIGRGASVTMSHIVGSTVGAGCSVGPFARLRGAECGATCRIGDFVEVKNSVLGDGVKSAHLAYIGDADVGDGTNVGCGTVFCNYDGKRKHRTEVGKRCFLGANVNLIAPVSVGDGAFVAAGTTVTDDVEDEAFVIGRSRQLSKPGRAAKDKQE